MELSLDYIGGLIDCDGSFSISVAFREGKYKQIELRPVVNFRQMAMYRDVVEALKDKFGVGKIYNHTSGGNFKMLTWQTTKKEHSLLVAKKILPYLRIKSDICSKFIEITERWLLSKHKSFNKRKGDLSRNPDEVIELARMALDLNVNNQTEANRPKKEEKLRRIELFLKQNYNLEKQYV